MHYERDVAQRFEGGKRSYVNTRENYANDPPLQVALREIRAIAGAPRFWIGMVAVIAILAVAAPFNTGDGLNFPSLIVYWAIIAVCTFFIALPVSVAVGTFFYQRGVPEVLTWIAGGIVAAFPVTGFVLAVNHGIFGLWRNANTSLLEFHAYNTAIAVSVVTIYYVVSLETRRDGKPDAATESPFFDRLPKALGTDIVSLQAQDHYLKVTTAVGSEMVLLRLTDAEKELATADGLRVHRSWWVAKKHVAELRRDGDRVFLEMAHGEEIPVSRSYVKAVREALGK